MSRIPKQDHKKSSSLIKQEVTKLKGPVNSNYLRFDFTYLDIASECFSSWEKFQLKKLSTFIKVHRERTINNIKIEKSGNSCDIKFNKHIEQYVSRFSEDILPIKAKHVYVGGTDTSERLHGFLHCGIFYVILLDKNHSVNNRKNKN